MNKGTRERAENKGAQPAREPERAAEARRNALRAPVSLPGDAVQLSRLAAASPAGAARAARAMQRRQGNTHMSQVAAQARQAAPVVQAKLIVTAPGDRYEQEADRAAACAVASLHAAGPDSMQRAPLSPVGLGVIADAGMPVESEIEAGIQAARGSGQPLPEGLRDQMEGALSADFAGVRVHTGPHAYVLNESLQARAFTTGQDIFFREGEYSPGSAGGRQLLAHELTHVIQQNNIAAPRTTISSQLILQRSPVNILDPQKAKDPKYMSYIKDYLRIQTYLRDESFFKPAIRKLDEMARQKKSLGKALLEVEQKYGINLRGIPIYTGQLKPEEFAEMSAKAVIPKDIGVPPSHGEFTHRIQWFVVLYNMTDGFTKTPRQKGFNHDPAELLTKTASEELRPPKDTNWPEDLDEANKNLWFALFDVPAFMGSYDYNTQGISSPEALMAALTGESALDAYIRTERGFVSPRDKLANLAPYVSAVIRRRGEKRQGMDLNEYIKRKKEKRKYTPKPVTYTTKPVLPDILLPPDWELYH
jgi:hypothetical protein